MERYESLALVGEGSYGSVLKCRHRDSGRLVAIKKFVDSDDDKTVKKIALREIKLLRQLHHANLVNLLEVWKRRRRWYLVFEFVERTLLEDLEHHPHGLDLNTSRQYLFQILRAAAFCHQHHIIHRDIKPENILISQGGVVKLCDFGFARTLALAPEGHAYTDYVATRWYRAPELLVGDIKYGKPVDVWALGCLMLEMLTGQPLFPGDSDLDQIHHIVRCFGNLTSHHQELFYRNPVFSGVRLPECADQVSLQQRFPTVTSAALHLAQSCLHVDPERRAHCSDLREHPLFTQDSFHIWFLNELNAKIQKDQRETSTLPEILHTPKRKKNDEGSEKKTLKVKAEKRAEEANEKEKKGEGEKVEKTKAKQPSKFSKTTRNTSEPFTTQHSKTTSGGEEIGPATRASGANKTKPGLKKSPESSTWAKTRTTDSQQAVVDDCRASKAPARHHTSTKVSTQRPSVVLHNMDTGHECDITVLYSSPPPPPPASSTPSSCSVKEGLGFHGNHMRRTEKTKHRGGIYTRQPELNQITASHTAKSPGGERSFLSDRCDAGNRKKSDLHLPDLKGRDGKHIKGVTKEPRKDKSLVPSPSAPQHP